MRQAAKAGRLYRERQFMLGIPAKKIYTETESEELVLVQGIIDAYFEEEGRLILVDYKTDRLGAEGTDGLVRKYQTQLDYYAQALERTTGKEVVEKIIYSFAAGREVLLTAAPQVCTVTPVRL